MECEKLRTELKNKICKYEADLHQLELQNKELQDKIDLLNNREKTHQSEIATLKTEVDNLDGKNKHLETQLQKEKENAQNEKLLADKLKKTLN